MLWRFGGRGEGRRELRRGREGEEEENEMRGIGRGERDTKGERMNGKNAVQEVEGGRGFETVSGDHLRIKAEELAGKQT